MFTIFLFIKYKKFFIMSAYIFFIIYKIIYNDMQKTLTT